MKGSLYRNGPGLYEVGEDKYQHMFDPLAMLQRFHIGKHSLLAKYVFVCYTDLKQF